MVTNSHLTTYQPWDDPTEFLGCDHLGIAAQVLVLKVSPLGRHSKCASGS